MITDVLILLKINKTRTLVILMTSNSKAIIVKPLRT